LGFISVWLVCGQKIQLPLVVISFTLLPFYALLITRSAVLQGFKKVIMAQSPMFILLPIVLVGGVFVKWVSAGGKTGGISAMAAHLVATVISLLLVLCFIRFSLPPGSRTADPEYRSREGTSAAFSLFMISGFALIIEQTDIIIIGLFRGATDAGIYSAAKRIGSFAASGLIIVNVILAPMISQFHVSGEIDEMKRVMRLAATFAFIIAFPIVMVILLFGDSVMALFGASFSKGYTSLLILTTGQLINALTGAVGFFMTMTGNEKPMTLICGSCALLNVALNFILIPSFGLEGAATSTALTVAFWNIILYVYVYQKFGIHTSVLSLLETRTHDVSE